MRCISMRRMDNFTPYTFGSMSLGRNLAYPEADLAVARRAMESGVWFHSSPTYNNGFTFMVLRMAFDAARRRVVPGSDHNRYVMPRGYA